jgi:DNA repair exonuclease SbcCD ATPase subunit
MDVSEKKKAVEEKKAVEGIEEIMSALKAQAEKAEAERVKLEKMLQEKRKESELLIPQLQAQLAELDKVIVEKQQEKTVILGQLKLLGLKTRGVDAKGARGGGLSEKMKELMQSVGVGGTITNSGIQEHLGSSSGYVGMIIKAQLDAGNLKRTQPGTFEVTGVPV